VRLPQLDFRWICHLKAADPDCRQSPTLLLSYQPLIPVPDGNFGYVRPSVLLEFNAHCTGEPHSAMPVTCEAATHLTMLAFPTAKPLVMDPKHTHLVESSQELLWCADSWQAEPIWPHAVPDAAAGCRKGTGGPQVSFPVPG
jgi:hypothetical protein